MDRKNETLSLPAQRQVGEYEEPAISTISTKLEAHLCSFHQDEEGYWVAELSCGHTQHLRHNPPWQDRAWVMDAQQRQQALGKPFSCGWCALGVAVPDQ